MSEPRCTINLNSGQWGTEKDICPAPAAYLAYLDGCFFCCEVMDWPQCGGHRVCVEHGAALRTTALPDRAGSLNDREFGSAVLARICSLDVAS